MAQSTHVIEGGGRKKFFQRSLDGRKVFDVKPREKWVYKKVVWCYGGLDADLTCHRVFSQAKDSESVPVSKDDVIDLDAIDNKIKDALVRQLQNVILGAYTPPSFQQMMKTSLSFAIHEEVDLLKLKVADLEMKIDELKSENRMLREYAPEEILKQIEEALMSPNMRSPMVEQAVSRIEM